LDQARYESTADFLANFKNVFTLNYDLLLYWTIMKGGLDRNFRDGFRGYEVLHWANAHDQNVYHLHGAMHIFQNGCQIEKVRSSDRMWLMNKIRERIDDGHAPMFICEGDSKQKLKQIENNPYLRHCFDRLGQLSGSLFIFGISNLSTKDEHIAHQIADSTVSSLFVGIHEPTPEKLAIWNGPASKHRHNTRC
jgi:hypothetical protein